MLYFLIIKSHRHSRSAQLLAPDDEELAALVPNASASVSGKWGSNDQRTIVYHWINKNRNFENDYFVHQSPEAIRLFNGWVNDGNPLKTQLCQRGTNFDNYSGEYLHLYLNSDGEGSIRRSLTGSLQLYYALNSDVSIVSNRASLVNAILNKGMTLQSIVDPQYMAWIMSTSGTFDDRTLFKNVKILKQNMSVKFIRQRSFILENNTDIWFDGALKSQYARNRKRYWDNCYDCLLSNLNFFFRDFDQPFSFPVSGKKGNRVLLGLICSSIGRNYLTDTHTSGPPYSGDVIAGRLVSNYLKIPHRFNDTNYAGASFDGKIGKHLFFSETELSPPEFLSNFSRASEGIVLRPYEAGLPNVGNVLDNNEEKITDWLYRHFGGFKRAGFLSDRHVINMRSSFRRYIEEEKKKLKSINNLPAKNRLETHFLRAGARRWTFHNTNEFAPFIFLDPLVVKHAYNAGAVARNEEDFLYEIMRRADPGLTKIPFSAQPWPQKHKVRTAGIPRLHADRRHLTGSPAIMHNNWSSIKAYIGRPESRDFLGNLINWKTFDDLGQQDLKPALHQPLWQLLQCSMISELRTFSEEAVSTCVNTESFPRLRDAPPATDSKGELYKAKSDKYGALLLNVVTERANNTPTPGKIKTAFAKILRKFRNKN